MRDRTRNYTTDLPRIGLPFLRNIRRALENAVHGAEVASQTESGTLHTFRQADGYAMTINGVTRAVRVDTTSAGYGIRHWYVCPHCMSRVAKLYIGTKDIACRGCWKLHYKSQSGDRLDRMRMSMRRQRAAIWGDDERTRNLFNQPDTFPKPKGMRWETFEKKRGRLIRLEEMYWQAYAPIVARISNGT